MSEDLKKQSIYLASVDLLCRLLRDGKFDREMLERLNRKNAETMKCKTVSLPLLTAILSIWYRLKLQQDRINTKSQSLELPDRESTVQNMPCPRFLFADVAALITEEPERMFAARSFTLGDASEGLSIGARML